MATRTGWDAANQAHAEARERSKKNGKFCTLDDDEEKVIVAFMGAPCVREVVWENGKVTNYTPDHEKRKVPPVVKFALNVFNKEAQKVQIFEQGQDWYKKVVEARDKYNKKEGYKFDECWFEIKRSGAKNDKNTRYSVLFDDKQTEDEKKMLRKIEANGDLYDLEKEINREDRDDDDDNKSSKSQKREAQPTDGPISDSQKEMLVSRLRDLPTAATGNFLKEFKVEKIKELPAVAFDAALEMLTKLEAEAKGGKAEVNPFD